MAFATAQSANFTAGPGEDPTLLADMQIRVNRPVVNITKAGAVTAAIFESTLPRLDFSGRQLGWTSGDIGLAQASTITIAETNWKLADFDIVRYWPLINTTGTGDNQLQFRPALGVISGQIRGWSTGATDYLQVGGTISISLDQIGTLVVTSSGVKTCRILDFSIGIPKARGGPVPVAVKFQVSDDADTASTAAEFDTTATTTAPEGTLTLSFSGGPAIPSTLDASIAANRNVINNLIRVSCAYTRGGPLVVYRNYVGSKAVA